VNDLLHLKGILNNEFHGHFFNIDAVVKYLSQLEKEYGLFLDFDNRSFENIVSELKNTLKFFPKEEMADSRMPDFFVDLVGDFLLGLIDSDEHDVSAIDNCYILFESIVSNAKCQVRQN